MDQDGHDGAYRHGNVASGPGEVLVGNVGVDDVFDNIGDLAAKHRVENLDQTNETAAEEDQRDDEEDDTDVDISNVVAFRTNVGEQIVTGVIDASFAVSFEDAGDIVVLGEIPRPAIKDLFVKLNDAFGEGIGENFEKIWIADIGVEVDPAYHGFGDSLEIVGGALHDKHEDDTEPVEHVVNRGAGEGSPELFPVSDLSDGDDGVGDGGANIRSEDHGDGNPHLQPRGHQPHQDGAGRGGGLHQDGDQHPDHGSDQGVAEHLGVGEEAADLPAAEDTEGGGEEGEGADEEVETC